MQRRILISEVFPAPGIRLNSTRLRDRTIGHYTAVLFGRQNGRGIVDGRVVSAAPLRRYIREAALHGVRTDVAPPNVPGRAA